MLPRLESYAYALFRIELGRLASIYAVLSATNEAVRASGKAGRPGNVAEGRRVGRVEIV